MITAERKPFTEIKEMIAPYRKVLVVGCGSCVAECASGGEKEVGLLASALRMDAKISKKELEVKEMTLDRQCVYEFIDQLTDVIDEYDVVLSLGCGAGIQAVAEVFPKVHIVPALNTTFIGETKEAGLWVENCRACGDCKLGFFAAVCPITRCAKGLLNGPCGGSRTECCEVDPDVPGNLSLPDLMTWAGSTFLKRCILLQTGRSNRGRDQGKSTGRIRGHDYRKQA
jgi:ferredoxin